MCMHIHTFIFVLDSIIVVVGYSDDQEKWDNSTFYQSRVHSSVVEHLTADQEVTGSNPVGPFFFHSKPPIFPAYTNEKHHINLFRAYIIFFILETKTYSD